MIRCIKKGKTFSTRAQNNRSVRTVVENIIADIQDRGDAAVREYSNQFDSWTPPTFRLSCAQIEECLGALTPQALADFKFAQAQIRNFAEIQLASIHDVEVETLPGVVLGHKNIPVASVG